MTIEEKTKEYVETCIDDDPVNPFAVISRIEGRIAFERGAQWMLSEIQNWFNNQPSVQYSAWGKLAEDSLEQFRKTIEK